MARGSCGAKGPPPPRTHPCGEQPCGARGIGVVAARPENPQQSPSKGGYVKLHRRSSCKSVRLKTFVNRRSYRSHPYQGHLFFSHLKVDNLTDNMQIANLKVDHLESAQTDNMQIANLKVDHLESAQNKKTGHATSKKNLTRKPKTRSRFLPARFPPDV